MADNPIEPAMEADSRDATGQAVDGPVAINSNTKIPAVDRVQHYPLDGPALPFDRYDHRRITARDIMVHRIMTDFMNPTRVKPSTYQKAISQPTVFEPIKSQDRELGLDLQVLRKMLFTSNTYDHSFPSAESSRGFRKAVDRFIQYPGRLVGTAETQIGLEKAAARKQRDDAAKQQLGEPVEEGKLITLGDQILDLVARHYLETDDSTLRTWISRARPPRIPTGPAGQPTTGRAPYRGLRRTDAVADFVKLVNAQRKRDGKQWKAEDTQHLKSLQAQANMQDKLTLFDGGVFVPHLKQRMDWQLVRNNGARHNLDQHHWSLTNKKIAYLSLPRWPEKSTTQRLFLQPSYLDLAQTKHPLKCKDVFTSVDLNINPGRGRNRDGWWTTGQGSEKCKGHVTSGGKMDGRFARRRRRCCSEPPPEAFTVADFPMTDDSIGSIVLEVVVPRMKLSTLDRRSRRRSLSRTRVEEMFDWDVILPRTARQFELSESLKPNELGTTTVKSIYKVRGKGKSKSKSYLDNTRDSDSEPDVKERSKEKPKDKPKDKSKGKSKGKSKEKEKPKPPPKLCQNCFKRTHETAECRSPCGHCGAPNPNAASVTSAVQKSLPPGYDISDSPDDEYEHHGPPPGVHQSPHLAPQCPVAKQNRCKCVPFPTFHVAARCPVPCSRPCGNTASKGSFRHKNAMLCRSRCCMCGIKGHSGRECRQHKCRCGGAHLGQDCGWKPECIIPGCDRFWCGMHCRECGSNQKPFVGWRCRKCLGDPALPESPALAETGVNYAAAAGADSRAHEHGPSGPPASVGEADGRSDGKCGREIKGKGKLLTPKKGEGGPDRSEKPKPQAERERSSIFGPFERETPATTSAFSRDARRR